MKRRLLAGIGLAGALTVFGGVAAFAEPDEAEPGAALIMQAEQKADMASAGVEACAEVKLLSLKSQTAPSGTSAEAWSQAVEQAQGKVETLAENADQQIETLTETFDNQAEQAAEDGTAAPSLSTLTTGLNAIFDPANPTAGVCGQINAVTITVAPVVTTGHDGDEQDTERDTESASTSGERD